MGVSDTDKDKNKKTEKARGRHTKGSTEKSRTVAAAVIIVVAVLLTAGIVAGHLYFRDKWYLRTTLNDVPVSQQILDETIRDFDNTYNNYGLTIRGRDNMTATILKDRIDLTIDADPYIRSAFEEQHSKFYLFALFTPQNIVMEPKIAYSEEKLAELLSSSQLIAGTDDKPVIEPVDACARFDKDKGYFTVIPEVEGNKINKEVFDSAVEKALTVLESEINIDDAKEYPDMFYAPSIRKDDEGLKKTCDAYNGSALHWINWNMPASNTVSITPEDIKAWYDMGEDYSLTLNEQAVMDWVESFCLKYKSVGKTRDFKTHSGNIIQVSGGDYGWQMNYDETVNQVLNVLRADNSENVKAYLKDNSAENRAALTTNLDPVYKNEGYKFNPYNITDDYDRLNYSEISIAEQYVYVYRGGELVFSAPVITGMPTPKMETTKGCWYIKERSRNKTLVGENNEYRTPVSYWVRITWSGIGYHDATWQAWGSWSPTKYTVVGSHGCINMSMSDVAQLYDIVQVGDPCFIY